MGQRRDGEMFSIQDDLTALGTKGGCWHQKALDRSRWMDQQDSRLIAIWNCVLLVREVLDTSVIRHSTSAPMRDNYQYKNKLEHCSILCVRDGSEAEGDWLFTSVSVTMISVATEKSELVASQDWSVMYSVSEKLLEDQGTWKGTKAYQKERSQCTYNKKQCSVNDISAGLRVLETLLSSEHHVIPVELFSPPFMGNM